MSTEKAAGALPRGAVSERSMQSTFDDPPPKTPAATPPTDQTLPESKPPAAAVGEHTIDQVPGVPPAGAAAKGAVRNSRFRILRTHARGGLGEVFLAQDEELGREV